MGCKEKARVAEVVPEVLDGNPHFYMEHKSNSPGKPITLVALEKVRSLTCNYASACCFARAVCIYR